MTAAVIRNTNKLWVPKFDPWRLLRPLRMLGGSQFYPSQPLQFMDGLLTPVIGASGPSFTPGTVAWNDTALTTYTLSVDIGAADDSRSMIFCIIANSTGSSVAFSSGTIAGIALSKPADFQNTTSYCAFVAANVPASAGSGTQTLSITLNGPSSFITAMPYRCLLLNSLVATATMSSSANPGTGTINVSERGLLFAGARQGNVSNTYTWTGVNEDYDFIVGTTTRAVSGGSYQATAAEVGRTVTATRSAAGNNFTMLAASFR